jgi:hypothetical protein
MIATLPRAKGRPRKDTCFRGHALTPENTRTRNCRGYPTRECRICNTIRYKERLIRLWSEEHAKGEK